MKTKAINVVMGSLLVGSCVLLACSGAQEIVKGEPAQEKVKGDRTRISHSEGVEPLWIQECPQRTEQILPFCGVALRQASMQTACASANGDALTKLRMSIGQKVNANLESDGQGGYRFSIQGVDNEPINIRGVWEDQRWTEEYDGPEGRTHDCYLMITYPKIEYDNLVATAQKADRDRISKASSLHQEGKDLAAKGYHAGAVVNFERALNLLSGLKEPLVTPGGINSTILTEQVTAELRISKEEAEKAKRTALVVIRMILDGKNEGGEICRSAHSNVKNWLAAKGFSTRPGGLPSEQVTLVLSGDREVASKTAAEKGAGLLLVIDIEVNVEPGDGNIIFAYARGALRLIRTADGRELAAADLGPEKQGWPSNAAKAMQKAVDLFHTRHLKPAVECALDKI